MKRLLLLSAFLGALAPVWAYDDSELGLGELHPFAMDGTDLSPHELYPLASAAITTGGVAAATAVSSENVALNVYFLSAHSIGMTVSEQMADYSVGEFLTGTPRAGDQIDWEKTYAALRASETYRDGLVTFIRSSTNASNTILFTGGGAVPVVWHFTDGNCETNVYQVKPSSDSRPYRLFWTSAPFNAPSISLKGKYVRFFGPADVLACSNEVTAASVTNVVSGIVLDESSQTLQARAKVIDYDRGLFQGPKGQFVLCYYTSGKKDQYVGHIVVEVSGPQVKIIKKHVGDELLPTGDGWNIEGLLPYVQKGQDSVDGDSASPHLAVADYIDPKTGEKVRPVYAISPTDRTANIDGLDTPGNADIYWEKPDLMGTLWPFEEDWYLVSWNPEDPQMVFAEGGDGLAAFVPTNYTVTVCDYQAPAQTATASGQAVAVKKEGRFLLKLAEGTDKVWYMPFASVSRTDARVCNALETVDRTLPVGGKLDVMDPDLMGTASEAFARVDENLPAYVYGGSGASAGRNWNARLYHEPTAPTLISTSTTLASDTVTDAFASLESALYGVGASETPIEVWWRQSSASQSRIFGTSQPLAFPCAVARYRVRSANDEDWPEIVIASRLGSRSASRGPSERAIVLDTAASSAKLYAQDLFSLTTNGCTFSFWVKPAPEELCYAEVSAGRVFTLETCDKGAGTNVTIAVDCLGVSDGKAKMAVSILDAKAKNAAVRSEFLLPLDLWSPLTLVIGSLPTARMMIDLYLWYGADKPLATTVPSNWFKDPLTGLSFGSVSTGIGTVEPAAVGMAIGSVNIWNRELDRASFEAGRLVPGSADDATQSASWDFASDSVRETSNAGDATAYDRIFRRKFALTGDYAFISPGSPVRTTAGVCPYENDVTPTVYRQAEKAGVGYHLNLSHAFTRLDDQYGDYATWALRSDLGTAGDTALVFTMYSAGGTGAMKTARVVLTNEYASALESTNTVGKVFLPPAPLSYLDGYWNNYNQWCSLVANDGNDKQIVYRDRKMNDWARRAGGGFAFYYYALRSDFDLPEGVTAPESGFIPWLSCLDGYTDEKVTKGHPLAWFWYANWPTEDVKTMYVGQTLTKAANGLPDVYDMASCAVIYPRTDTKVKVGSTEHAASVATLIDPIQANCASLAIKSDFPSEYGFTVGSGGTCQLKKGQYFFSGLPPSVSERFYIDSNAAEAKRMVLVGSLVTPATGNAYLQLNVPTAEEKKALKAICTLASGTANKTAWDKAVDSLRTVPYEASPSSSDRARRKWDSSYLPRVGDRRTVVNTLSRLNTLALDPSSTAASTNVTVTVSNTGTGYVTHDGAFAPQYNDIAKYALMASGNDAGYIVLIENDSTNTAVVAEGNPVDVKVIRVLPELYTGTITALSDPLNKLSELLTIQYNEPFGAATEQYEFQWFRRGPEADGTVNTDYSQWGDPYKSGNGLVSFTIGGEGATLDVLGNKYYVMKYRANAGTTAALTVGTGWSGWTDRTLAESWVQRVLNSVTPFAQRIEDFYSQSADLKYTMFEQIGKPYTGDVALNNNNLSSVGLIELYQTVFNKAEKMSIGIEARDADVNKQLLLAASRLSDLYQLLGAEAYADAKNPLISQGVSSEYLDELLNLPSCTFCFQNQVATLLDEELALLRGRSNATQSPNMKTTPFFNRLMWNFTKGITEGEVAYVNNYGISSNDGVITVDTAQGQYPQGHGDAWGHYLSAITGYYHLLRNPYFDWYPSMMELLVSQTVANNDDYDENKFADAALKLAQTGLDVVDLTARKAWRDNAGNSAAAYFDDAKNVYPNESDAGRFDVRQAFGYGQFAVRAGLGAIYNWATVNSLLPTNAVADETYADVGIRKIDRTTVTQLPQLALLFQSLQTKLDSLDSGLNPLGLSQNAVSMDIDPSKLEERNSHFDQILERAERALENCTKTLDYANLYGARLQQIQNAEGEATTDQKAQETAYRNQLIAIYGTPYSGDIGVGGTYEQGYDGPDLYHYNYMDLDQFGLSDEELRTSFVVVLTNKNYNISSSSLNEGDLKDSGVSVTKFEVTSGGIVKKPASVTGVRATEGSVQTAYRQYLNAYIAVSRALKKYYYQASLLNQKYNRLRKQYSNAAAAYAKQELMEGYKIAYGYAKAHYDRLVATLDMQDEMSKQSYELLTDSLPEVTIAGMAVSVPMKSVGAAAGGVQKLTGAAATAGAKVANTVAFGLTENLYNTAEAIWSTVQGGVDLYDKLVSLEYDAIDLATENNAAVMACEDALGDLETAEAAYRQEVYKGQLILEEREQWRKECSSTATRYRYADMYNRIQRNNALTKYSTAFDIAQKYVWELAKVYDYETALLSSDSQAGDAFLAEIVGSRQLGYEGVSTSSATDKGLYDIVNRMKENWSVLRHRLGVDNPDTTTKWFSLRYSLFRIARDAKGDEAWQDELEKYWVDDILADTDFRRYCQPMGSSTDSAQAEPGLVIPFSTSINNRENFFGKTLMGGEAAYSSSDYATKVHSIGVKFAGYDALTTESADGLALDPNIYLVPVGIDYMRAPAGTTRKVIGFKVIDQVLPLPYQIGSTELDDTDYVASFQGMDGTSDSAAVIRRHSTLQADGSVYSTRLVGRSVWNDRWLLVIPASALNGVNPERGLKSFIKGVEDIQLGIRAYSRNGN